jgi:ribosomal protein S18 acetylase RimI-like enzyme
MPSSWLFKMSHRQLSQIEASLRAVGRHERAVIRQLHFEIFISPSQVQHLNFATPLAPDPADWTEPIAALQAVFVQHGKRPYLEFIADLHPALAPALERADLVCESRTPLMVLDLARLGPPPEPAPLAVYQPLAAGDEAFLKSYLRHQSVAYGGDGGEDALAWLPHLQSGLENNRVLGAVLLQDGEMVSGAVIQLGDGSDAGQIGELAGVWTAPQRRHQGLAYALCHRLLRDYAITGHGRCWLSAAEGAQRLYERLGFVQVGTQLNYGLSLAQEEGLELSSRLEGPALGSPRTG